MVVEATFSVAGMMMESPRLIVAAWPFMAITLGAEIILVLPSDSARASLALRTVAVRPDPLRVEKTRPRLGAQSDGALEVKVGLLSFPGVGKVVPVPPGVTGLAGIVSRASIVVHGTVVSLRL